MRAKYYSLAKKVWIRSKYKYFGRIPKVKIYSLNLEIVKMKIKLCIYLESGVTNHEKSF